MKNRIIAAAAAGTLLAVGFAAPALATDTIAADPVVCYEDVTHTEFTYDKQKWQIVTPAVPAIPAVPGIPGVPAGPDTYTPLYDYSETRATGHFEATENGLHIWTEGSTSTDKVALYRFVNIPLSSVTGGPFVEYTASVGITPGSQVVVDFDGNGTADGILVNEPAYVEQFGDASWLSNSAAQFVKDGAPHKGGGHGSENYGTPQEWATAFPYAKVVAVGFSLGSGVLGDGIVHFVNVGGTEYWFTQWHAGTPAVPEVPEIPAVPEVPAVYGWVTVSSGQGLEVPTSPYEGKRYVQTGTVEVTEQVEVECPVVVPEPEETVTPTPEETITPAPAAQERDGALAETGGAQVSPLASGIIGVVIVGGAAFLVISAVRARRQH